MGSSPTLFISFCYFTGWFCDARKSFRDGGSGVLRAEAGWNCDEQMVAWQGWHLEREDPGDQIEDWMIDEGLKKWSA